MMSAPDPTDPNRDVFDRDELLASIHGDHHLLEQFVELFLEDFPRKIEALRAAALADATTLRVAVHKTLGSATTMRLNRLARAARDLQGQIDSGEYQEADLTAGVTRIIDEYHAAAAVLKR